MGVCYLIWFLLTLLIFLVYKNIDSLGSVDLQYFLYDTLPDELPTT